MASRSCWSGNDGRRRTRQASHSVASYRGTKPSKASAPPVVGMSVVWILYFNGRIGMRQRDPRSFLRTLATRSWPRAMRWMTDNTRSALVVGGNLVNYCAQTRVRCAPSVMRALNVRQCRLPPTLNAYCAATSTAQAQPEQHDRKRPILASQCGLPAVRPKPAQTSLDDFESPRARVTRRFSPPPMVREKKT